ncbi:MAG: hypothetical protein ACI4WR_04515 [Bulleidia sp.]
MDWDRACRSNSGGEHSLSWFIVIASLMAYLQNDNAEFEGDGRNENYETVICDNPFASVSSEQLMCPLVQIVQALHIQLITFTHITSQSIANSFDAVIQLRNARSSESQTGMTAESESVSEQVSRMEQAGPVLIWLYKIIQNWIFLHIQIVIDSFVYSAKGIYEYGQELKSYLENLRHRFICCTGLRGIHISEDQHSDPGRLYGIPSRQYV